MPTYSMTGFGRGEKTVDAPASDPSASMVSITVEMKSVNHRFLDISVKSPGMFQRIESEIQKLIRSQLRRGRVDVFLSRTETGSQGNSVPQLNEAIFLAAYQAHQQAFQLSGITNEELGKLESYRQAVLVRGVIESGMKEPDLTVELPLALEAAAQALSALKGMRLEEGKALEQELNSLLLKFESVVDFLSKAAALSPKQFEERLQERISRLLSGNECEPQRLAQEVAILVDKADVTEELARLRSHIAQFRSSFGGEEGGKKLEFLLQEMGREINTTGSKSQSAEIAQSVVEAKLILERLREQVLNVE